MDSPPRRITRARAAKTTGPRTTKIVTAAAQARTKSTPTASTCTKTTAAKRKTRADDSEDEEDPVHDRIPAPRKATRGRPKKRDDTQAASTASVAKPTRGRPAKKQATDAAKAEAAEAAKPTRGRPKKSTQPANAETAAPEPPKKVTRARGTAAPTATTKPGIKKTVKFEEPDKENVEPVKRKEPAATGLRGKPARRGGATAARATRKEATPAPTASDIRKKPLSPRKVTQMPVSRDEESEDELAGFERTPIPPMRKSPVKPPTSVMAQAKEPPSEGLDEDATITVNAAILNPPNLVTTTLTSPARRIPPSAQKETMKSPARKIGAVPFPGSAIKSAQQSHGTVGPTSPTKGSLLLSAAKRPLSPVKNTNYSSPTKSSSTPSAAYKSSMLQTPAKRGISGLKPVMESASRKDDLLQRGSPAMKPLASTPGPVGSRRPSEKLLLEEYEPSDESDQDGERDEETFTAPIEKVKFPGRLSAVMPREADPDPSLAEEEDEAQQVQTDDLIEDVPLLQEELDTVEDEEAGDTHPDPATEPVDEEQDAGARVEEPTKSEAAAEVSQPEDSEKPEVAAPQTGHDGDAMFQLDSRALPTNEDFDAESDSELMSPARETGDTPTAKLAQAGHSRRSTIGLTSLAEQCGQWSAAASPTKKTASRQSTQAPEEQAVNSPAAGPTPASAHFFEDEMTVRPDFGATVPQQPQSEPGPEGELMDLDEPFNDVATEPEDLELAKEAESMVGASSPRMKQGFEMEVGGQDDTLSDASQEYGDENEVPVDPAMAAASAAPVTPVRPEKHTFFHTTTKVPLKASEESTPSILQKRSFTAPRVTAQRSSMPEVDADSNLTPSKKRTSLGPATPVRGIMAPEFFTPTVARAGTDPHLLKGAVVFVDVHTSEGADASGIFVELLTQMGARCRKHWDWNPDGSSNNECTSHKIGITHVVFKDGGKRTLEKVRRTKGLVQCVGVSWVLDCERDNTWLDERSYLADTGLVPRGGARRRRSMEPRALANMNGTLVDNGSTSKGTSPRTPSPSKRRESTQWMHTPSDQGLEGEQDDIEWSKFILTPVPKTPAPDAVARAAAALAADDSITESDDDASCGSPMDHEALLMRTCPPKTRPLRDLTGSSPLKNMLDEHAMQRLMAARRRSMQYAPKIGSPLAKAWK
ncbi:uncharacterized protein J7T54_000662 [Emericellopsis cladophorae]|uniref:BRCT domain-containing protein n=1 Tax=Emericellopsis cladophorae TaxID=2686198 RepID=A0A9P9Y4G6_9HYPO|nr:uncharacterized protein J7T54_000662 [Emericellopsis cladophorae]KAI6783160.1 hypothetical protein J7T54_000662 [Emericellopsis cladophorae]